MDNAFSFFIADALAQQAAPAAQPNFFVSVLPLVLLFVVFYFFLIRPQTKRAKEHKQMVEGLKKGDEIITGGGVLGRIIEVGENFLQVEFAEGVQFRVQKQAVANLMPKGTFKGDL